ncbi:hypothetical protein [Comamonas thiooxydans]|uniref:hypothetical protein n=1 Tax=Comamonas thiooxydans TaxID=363952 RepID=UPI000B411ACD|nr:hypothetical protein [Comamonas thiooxydans]
MDRRKLLALTASVGLASMTTRALAAPAYSTSPGLPSSPTGMVLLELVNFGCSRCKAVNEHYTRIHRVARDLGVDFRCAPIAWVGQSIWTDRVYYAGRDLYPLAESLFRDAMFTALHSDGMRFENADQVQAYLGRRKVSEAIKEHYPAFSLEALIERAKSDDVMISEGKAIRLLEQSAATEMPVFLWIAGGEIVHTVMAEQVNGDPRALVNLVISTLNKQLTH